jgi:AraC-like DNA-binding protein
MMPHAHREHHAIVHLSGPDASFILDGASRRLSQGEMLLIGPWTSHGKIEATISPVTLLSLLLAPDWLAENAEGAKGDGRLWHQKHVRRDEIVLGLAVEVFELLSAGGTCSRSLLATMTSKLAIELLRRYAQPCLTDGGVDFRIRRAMHYLKKMPVAALKVDEAIAHAGLSRSQFYKYFTKTFGVSPLQVIDTRRMEHAVGSLLHDDVKIADIAAELGFSRPGHFTRFFKSHISVSPMEYRRGRLLFEPRIYDVA